MYKTIGIVAHVDAGKTTFSEQLLHYVQKLKKIGRVDQQNSHLDYHSIEKERGITVFADETTFSFHQSHYTLIDTPGHLDFAPQFEQNLSIMDAAIVIINATDAVPGHTKNILSLLKKKGIPTCIFFNKADLLHEPFQIDSFQSQIEAELLLAETIEDSEEQLEQLASLDEQLVEVYLNGELDFNTALQTSLKQHTIYPYCIGSALQGTGVSEMMHAVDRFITTDYDEAAPLTGVVYKIRYDAQGQKNTFVKINSGQFNVRDEIQIGEEKVKVTEIRSYSGESFNRLTQASAGQLIALLGSKEATVGQKINEELAVIDYFFTPALRATLTVKNSSIPMTTLYTLCRQLSEEEPSLNVHFDETTQEISFHVMGEIQLEVLQQLFKERYQLDVNFQEPTVMYRETVASPTVGYAHFEPLRHYAEVHLELSPLPSGQGIQFKDHTHPNEITSGNRTEIKGAIFNTTMHGVLTGSPLTDVLVTLLRAKGHEEYTAPGDFRQATWRAMRTACMLGNNILLEPIYALSIEVSIEEFGKITSAVQKRSGIIAPPQQGISTIQLEAEIPVATFKGFPAEFASITNGNGQLSFYLSHYAPCHNTEEVVQQRKYDPRKDPAFTAASVFLEKGAGYSVPFEEVPSLLHLETYGKQSN